MTTTENPLVSVIVPVYNVERYLDSCLDSIRNQTYQHLEIIVVEDCSTDGSLQALTPHLEDGRVRLLQHDSNSGLSAARNTGIEAATGDYVLFVDSDDVIDRTLVESCVDCAQERDADVVLFNFVAFRDGDDSACVSHAQPTEEAEPIDGVAYFELPHFAWLKFLRADLLENPALRFPIGYYYEDWPFHWELGFTAKNMYRLPLRGYQYRLREGSITGSGGRKLFHIFSSHRLVVQVVDRHAAPWRVRAALASKIYRGIWFVVLTSEGGLLGEAITRAREHMKATREQRRYASPSLKHRLMTFALHLPQPLRGAAVGAIREAAARLSATRSTIQHQNAAN